MSVYNGERYLHEAMESILAQTFGDFEFLIINDGSTDGTREVLETCRDTRVRLVHQSNMGLTRSLNKGLRLARGDVVARMDADDTCRPERLAKQIEVFKNQPSIALVPTGYSIAGPASEGHPPRPEFTYETLPALLLEGNVFMHGSVAFRKGVVLAVGGYDEAWQDAQDYDLWLRLAWHKYRFCFVEERLCTWRAHGESMTARRSHQQEEETVVVQLRTVRWIRQHPEIALWVDRTALRKALVGLSWDWRYRRPACAREAIRLLLSFRPADPEAYKLYLLTLPGLRSLARAMSPKAAGD